MAVTRRRASPTWEHGGGEADLFGLFTASKLGLYGCAVAAVYACFFASVYTPIGVCAAVVLSSMIMRRIACRGEQPAISAGALARIS